MSLIFAGNWQELLSKMYTPIAYNPACFNHARDNDAFILQSAFPQCTASIPCSEHRL